jgi:hypothetical protein
MPAVDPSNVPDITVKQLIQDGVDALSANVALLDGIWAGLAAGDIAKLKTYWGTNPPTVLTGFARRTDPFPCFAVTLASDTPDTDLLDNGGFLDEDEGEIGRETTTSAFRIFVFAENPDVCAAYYRVLRRILQAGKRKLESRGLYNPSLSGAELAPDPSYTPDNLFTRQVTLTVLIEESWSMDPATDALAAALVPTQPARLSTVGTLNVAHTDAGGGVTPTES